MRRNPFICLLLIVVILTSCKSLDEYREERILKAEKAFEKIKSNDFPENDILTLPYCIHLALDNNLDLKVYELKAAVDKEKKTAAMLGMLPDLIVSNDVTYRTNEPGAKSVYLTGPNAGTQSLAYSKSTDPFENRVRVELIFSAIDFGLAFCNYIQQDDRAILTSELQRRAAQNLILDVTRSYLRVAAAQYAMETTEKMITLSIQTEQTLQQLAKNKTVPLISVLEENKKFIVLKKALMEYRRNYQNSCIELRSLMGYYPTDEIKVDISAMHEFTELTVPNIEFLEEVALIERPELFQIDIQSHITLIEARKTIITMFPNVQLFLDFTNSSNPFLYHYNWWEMGARAAYNLLKLPQKLEHYYALEAEGDQLDAQSVALSVGVLAQVRIAHANLTEVRERYDLSEDLLGVYKQHESVAKLHSKSAGALSEIELSRIKIETEQRSIERTQALGNYYLAYFRLLNSLGIGSLAPSELEVLKSRVEESIRHSIEDILDNIVEYHKEIDELQLEITGYNDNNSKLESENELLTDELAGILNEDSDRYSDITDTLASNNEDIKENKDDIQKIEISKSALIEKLNAAELVKQERYKKIDKYNAAIKTMTDASSKSKVKTNKLLEHYNELIGIDAPLGKSTKVVALPHGVKADVGEETVASQSRDAIDSMTIGTQKQSGTIAVPNSITTQEYIPSNTNNIIVEAQEDANNNRAGAINDEMFNPMSQRNITIETLKDTNNNLLTGESTVDMMNRDRALSNGVQRQLDASSIQPGRDGY